MDQSEDPRELERKIQQAARIASHVNDPTTVERLRAWIEDLKQVAGLPSGYLSVDPACRWGAIADDSVAGPSMQIVDLSCIGSARATGSSGLDRILQMRPVEQT